MLAAELYTAGILERADSGYRVLDWEAVQACIERVRELSELDERARPKAAPRRLPALRHAMRSYARVSR